MTQGQMSYLDAAVEVLRRYSPGAPMHYRRITEMAVSDGLIVPGGATPEASMVASISQDIKRREASGREQRFHSSGRGFYGLAQPSDPLGGAIEANNRNVRQQLRDVLASLDPRMFEELVGQLLVSLGFTDVEVTRYYSDGGIDVRATLTVGGITDVQTAVQVKRWANNVSGKTVRELRGGLGPHERGLIVTLSDFTPDARAEAAAANRSPISLVNGSELIELLVESQIGVVSRSVAILQLDASAVLGDETATEVPPSPPAPRSRKGGTYSGSKALSMWPLPGGRLAWKQSLDKMLAFVAQEAPNLPQALAWMVAKFPSVESPKTARGYWQLARSFGLMETEGEQLTLTAEGAEYLANPTSEALLSAGCAHIAGLQEMLDWLSVERSVAELLAMLREHLGVEWETDAQVGFRLGWLETLGVVAQHGGRWRLVDAPQ